MHLVGVDHLHEYSALLSHIHQQEAQQALVGAQLGRLASVTPLSGHAQFAVCHDAAGATEWIDEG